MLIEVIAHLDPKTVRGILKQPQYQPLSVAEQIAAWWQSTKVCRIISPSKISLMPNDRSAGP